LPFKNKKIFYFGKLIDTYHVKDYSRYFTVFFLFFFLQKRGYISPKIGEKKISKSVSGYFKTKNKKILLPLSSGGGGEALMAQLLRNELFLMLPNKKEGINSHVPVFFIP